MSTKLTALAFLETLGVSALAVIAPIHAVMLMVVFLPVADMVTGILASRKSGQKISSAGLRRTVAKITVYEIAILLAFGLQQTGLDGGLPLAKLCASMVALTELKSVFENIDVVVGKPVFGELIDRLRGQVHKK